MEGAVDDLDAVPAQEACQPPGESRQPPGDPQPVGPVPLGESDEPNAGHGRDRFPVGSTGHAGDEQHVVAARGHGLGELGELALCAPGGQ